MYLRYLLFTTITILAIVASLNYVVLPAYLQRMEQRPTNKLAEDLIKSEYGLWWPDNFIPERALKIALANHAKQADCVIIGSSHIMQIGSARKVNALSDLCDSVINLGVSGGTIEDQFVLVHRSLHDGQGGIAKKIILGVDPWTFAFGKNTSWHYYAADYQIANSEILGRMVKVSAENPEIKRIESGNLLSLEHTVKSLRSLHYNGTAAPVVREDEGGLFAIFYRDGSLQYDNKFLVQARHPERIGLGGDYAYATNGVLNERAAIDSYVSLIRWIKSKGVEPVLLLTPYHHNVWKRPFSLNTRALMETEPIVRQIGLQLGVTVIGTYDPIVAGCSNKDFLDFMHAKISCLVKLRELKSNEITNVGQAWLNFPVSQYKERARDALQGNR